MSKTIEPIKREEVLGLDPATHFGYYSLHGGGTWDFTESLHRNGNKQHKALRDTLMQYIIQNGIRQIVMEDVNVWNPSSHPRSSIKLCEFRGIVFEICDELDLPEPALVNVTTVKKFATGNGKADKAMMMKACKDRWGIDTHGDDNMADAAHIFFYYVKRFNL